MAAIIGLITPTNEGLIRAGAFFTQGDGAKRAAWPMVQSVARQNTLVGGGKGTWPPEIWGRTTGEDLLYTFCLFAAAFPEKKIWNGRRGRVSERPPLAPFS